MELADVTTISAKVLAHSICSVSGKEIMTFQLTYPRWIHAEFMTHRQFSRNASSSRAIPVERMIDSIMEDPAVPIYWGKNQKGMQATEECTAEVRIYDRGAPCLVSREKAWLDAMYHAIDVARGFHAAGYHKQIVNRLLEPFMHITVVVTSTEWSNWYALRDHKDAEPHIEHLAKAMREAAYLSSPDVLEVGQWHTPYVGRHNFFTEQEAIITSVARCARTSYLTHEGKATTLEEDRKLHDRLLVADPLHASPAEHQATPDPYGESRSQWGNFQYWKQYRKTLPGECK
jgi:thymidylate synthase ThyX